MSPQARILPLARRGQSGDRAVLWVGVDPFTAIPPLVWATLIAVVLSVSAGYHTYAGREMTLTEYVAQEAESDD